MNPLTNDSVPSEETLNILNRARYALAADIQAISGKLLMDPRAREAFARVGLDEPFSEEETKLIYEELGLARAFEPASLIPATHYSDITQALARRTVWGMYSSVDCAEATAFVKRNAFPHLAYEAANERLPGKLGPRPKEFDPYFNKVPFEDYVRVFKYIANSKTFADYAQKLRNTDDQSGDSEEYKDLEYEIHREEGKIFRRHGLIGGFTARSEIGHMRYRGLDVNDEAIIRTNLSLSIHKRVDFGE